MPWDSDTQYNVAEQWVGDAFSQEGITSGDKYYAWLQDNDQQITRAVARDVWNEFHYSYQWVDSLAKYPDTATIPRGWYGSTQSDYIPGYGYKVQMNYVDPLTGEDKTRAWLVNSDSPMTLEDIDDAVSRGAPAEYPELIGQVTSYDFTAIYHHKGTAW